MNTYTTTIIMDSPDHLNNVVWHRCISDALERYRAETGHAMYSAQFCVKGTENHA